MFPKKVVNSIKFVGPFRVGGRNCPGGARHRIAQGERPQGANPGAGKGRLFEPRRGATVPSKYIGGEIVAPFQGAMPWGITYPWFAPCGHSPGAILCFAPLGRLSRSAAFETYPHGEQSVLISSVPHIGVAGVKVVF